MFPTNSAAGGEMPSPHLTSPDAFSPRAATVFDRMVARILRRTKDARATSYADLIADGFTPGQIGTHFPKAKAAVDAIVFRQDDFEAELEDATERALIADAPDAELLALATEHVTGMLPTDRAIASRLTGLGLAPDQLQRLWPALKRNTAAHAGSGKLAVGA